MKKTANLEGLRQVNLLLSKLDGMYHRASRCLNVSDSIMGVLYVVYEKGDGCLLRDIYGESGLPKQTVNSAVRTLERQRLLYLVPAQGRNKRVCLTEDGKDFTAKTAGRIYRAEADAFGGWPDEKMELYLQLVKEYADAFGTQVDKLEEEANGKRN